MQAGQIRATANVDPATLRSIERVYRDWDAALRAKDVEAAVALYAEDVQLESPLVRHLTGSPRGVIEGRDNLREFIRIVFARTPTSRGHYRSGFFTDGRKLIWEYTRDAGWRSDGLRRIDGDREWPNPAALRLLGLVWRRRIAARRVSSIGRVSSATARHSRRRRQLFSFLRARLVLLVEPFLIAERLACLAAARPSALIPPNCAAAHPSAPRAR
jgi:hypothetical protein